MKRFPNLFWFAVCGLLFVGAYLLGASAIHVAQAGVKDEPKGMPVCTQMTMKIAGEYRIYEVWYTENQFIVRDHGSVCLGPECDKNKKTDKKGLLELPPKIREKVGM